MRGLLLSIAVFAAGLVPGVRAAHAQPPPGELNELILLLRPGETHPSPEEVVSAVNESRGLTGGLAEGDPFAAEHLLSRRAQGPLRDWIRENSEHPRSRLERYVVLSYHSPVDVAAIAESLEQSAHVEHAEVNRLLTLSGASAIPSDPLLDPSSGDPGRFQWAAQVMRLVEAAALARGGGTAGIIDRGLDPLHPDLRMFHREPDGTLVYDGGNFVDHMSRNLVDDTCDVDEAPVDPILDRAGHGDHVAGLLAATTDNDIGGMGACPGCAFAVQKAFKADTDQGAMNNAAEALTELVGLGVQVVNMSFGVVQQPCTTVPLDLSALCQAIDLARRRDIVLVAASGNNRSDQVDFPANSDQVIAVGGVAYDSVAPGGHSFWDDCPTGMSGPGCNCLFGDTTTECGSNYGEDQSLAAPGKIVVSTMYAGFFHNETAMCGDTFLSEFPGFGPCSGSSMSSALVSGTAAQCRSVNPLLDRDEIQDALETTASQAEARDDRMGFGVPNAEASVGRVLGSVGGQTLVNRLTPVFILYNPVDQTHALTTSPTFASALLFDIDAPFISVGPAVGGYDAFPDAACVISPCFTVPGASFYVFTSHRAPFPGAPPLVPLVRMRYDPNLPFRCDLDPPDRINNRDFAYTSSEAGILHFTEVLQDENGQGYHLEAIEGYIFGRCEPEPDCIPEGAERIYRLYNPDRDDYAIFPESELPQWQVEGYVSQGGSLADWIGYSYPNVDSDGDFVIDGFEKRIGTDPLEVDSDCDGLSDGEEVLSYDMTSPLPSQHGYGDALSEGLCELLIFGDGFESGDTSRWSETGG